MKNIFLFLFLFSFLTLTAQEYKSFTIENISEETVWNAVNKTMQELKMPHVSVNKNTGKGETGYYNYTALMIKNRCKFRFEHEEGNLTVSVFGRQYMSDKGWAVNMLPMTKKQASNILEPIEKRITELTKNNPAQKSQVATQTKTVQSKTKAGIYDDFVIARTGDPEMDLLAIHKNGNIMGIDLDEDHLKVRAIVFQENKDAESVTLIFNDEGVADALIIGTNVLKVNSSSENKAKLTGKNLSGNILGTESIELPRLPADPPELMESNPSDHGPSYIYSFQDFDPERFARYLGYAATSIQVIGCSGLAVSGIGTPLAAALCGSALLSVAANFIPQNSFLFNELSLVSAITGFIPATPVETILTGIKNAIEAGIRLKERHWPTPKITISGATKIRSGAFGEYGYSLNVYASSNFPNEPIQWDALNDELKIEQIYIGDQEYVSGLYGVRVFAKEKDWASYPVLEATLVVDGEVIISEIKIEIVKPNYYYLNSCNNCSSDPKYIQECETQLKQCINTLKKDVDNIYFVIDENNNILSSNKDLNNARLAFIKSSNPGNHGFIPLVKEAPCSFSCEGLSDKETIISLAHEGMELIRKTESRIEVLQRQITEKNYTKIGADLKSEEDFIKRIRKEYGDKINKIAEKGTIRMAIRKSDPAKYYEVNGVRVVGAHWQRKLPSILIEVDLDKKPIPIIVNDEQFYETAGDIRFQYLDSDGKIIEKGTAIFTQFALFAETFEKIELIDFNSSLSVLRKKTSDDGLDTFY